MLQDVAWEHKYRPRCVADTILPQELKKEFQAYVNSGTIDQTLLLSGRPGIGKTTVAKAMLDEMGSDYIVINGSKDGNIDTLRVDITNFASSVSFTGKRKFVILDEADGLNPQSTQPALRNFMDEYSKNCGFILTANFKNRIIEPLQSRCSVVDFVIPKDDKPLLAKQFFMRLMEILDAEGVTYDKQTLVKVIQKYFPDWRRAINEIQRYSKSGHIDNGIFENRLAENVDELVNYLKTKDFTKMRKWVSDNSDIDSAELYQMLYDILPKRMSSTASIAACSIILAKYQYQESFVASVEINRAGALTELMIDGDWD